MDDRFVHFLFLRLALRLIDWERQEYGTQRPGRVRRPAFVSFDEDFDDVEEAVFDDLDASRERVETWLRCSMFNSKSLSAWIVDTLDEASAAFGRSTNRAASD